MVILRIKQASGFTLIEILVAMLITTVLVLGLNAAVKQAYFLYSQAENRCPIYQKTRLLTETLRTELSSLYLPPNSQEKEDENTFIAEPTKLEYFTLTPALAEAPSVSHINKITMEFTKNKDTNLTTITRTQQMFSGEKAMGSKTTSAFLDGNYDLSLQAYDPNEKKWKDSYKSKNLLPPALKMTLVFPDDNLRNVPSINFETIFHIPTQASLTN